MQSKNYRDERLEELMFMACEKDITDEILVQSLATLWACFKSRRIAVALSVNSERDCQLAIL